MEWLLFYKLTFWSDVQHWLSGSMSYSEQQKYRFILWRPVFIAIGIGLYFGTSYELSFHLQSLVLIICLLLLILSWVRNWTLWNSFIISSVFLVILGHFLTDIRANYVAAPVIPKELFYKNVSGIVTQIDRYEGRERIIVENIWVEGLDISNTPKKIRISYPKSHAFDGLEIGDKISTQASLRPPPLPSVSGLYDFARVAWFKQIGAIGYTTKPIKKVTWKARDNESSSSKVIRSFNRFRDNVTVKLRVDLIDSGNSELEGLRAALITGDRTGINQHTYSVIRDSGLAHLLAISGLHMGLLAMLVFAGLRIIFSLIPAISLRYNSKKIAAFTAICVAAFYMFLSGQTVPTERAFIMTAIVLSGVLVDRNVISLRTVSIAASVILLLHPETLLSASFQLSFAAVICLVAMYESEYLKSAMKGMQQTFLLRIARYVLFLALTTLIASTATAPFSLYHFGQIATYGLIANLIAVPIMGVIVMPAAILSMLLMPFGLEVIGLYCMDFGLSMILDTANWVSSLDGAVISYSKLNDIYIILFSLMVVWFFFWKGPLRYLSFMPLILILLYSSDTIERQIFVDGEGRMIGYYDPQIGAFSGNASGQKFVKKLWLTSWGEVSFKTFDTFRNAHLEHSPKESSTLCSREGCRFMLGPNSIFSVNSQEAAYEACNQGGVVIFLHGYIDRASCFASKIIDRKELKRDGGFILTKYTNSSNIEIVTVREEIKTKPWYKARYK